MELLIKPYNVAPFNYNGIIAFNHRGMRTLAFFSNNEHSCKFTCIDQHGNQQHLPYGFRLVGYEGVSYPLSGYFIIYYNKPYEIYYNNELLIKIFEKMIIAQPVIHFV